MADHGGADAVSITILILLMFISCVLVAYVSLFLYTRYKRTKDDKYPHIEYFQPSWLDGDRKPLIPGSVHTRTVQPVLSNDDDQITDEEELSDEADFKERDYTKLGRIIFVMRYHKKREELMVRLVQIEGLPVSQELYSPNSAYVDVQLKYTGSPNSTSNEVQKPPRLDICLQQVYYFIISTQQMMSHALEFQINTFDDQFRRYVSGMVELNLNDELGDDILTGNEVVFVKEIMEPFKFSEEQHPDDDDFVSAVSDIEDKQQQLQNVQSIDEEDYQDAIQPVAENESDDKSRAPSHVSSNESLASSNMSWEPEVSADLLSISMNSLFYRCSSEMDLSMNPLTQDKRSHSIGYLPTYEWTVTDIPLDDEPPTPTTTTEQRMEAAEEQRTMNNYYTLYDEEFENDRPSELHIQKDIQPPPESFYRIVPVTPLHPKVEHLKAEYGASASDSNNPLRKVAYKKHSKRKQVARSLSINRRLGGQKPKVKRLEKTSPLLERSSSWPSLVPGGDYSLENSPVHGSPMK